MMITGAKEARRSLKSKTEKLPKALSQSLNRVGQGVVTEATRKVKEIYQIQSKEVKAAIRIHLTNPTEQKVEITSRGGNLPLIRYKVAPKTPPKRPPKALKASVRRGETKNVKRSFTARMRSGHVGVFKRLHPSGQSSQGRLINAKGDRPELPIEELFGPAVPVMLNEPGVILHVQKEAENRMFLRLEHEINRIWK